MIIFSEEVTAIVRTESGGGDTGRGTKGDREKEGREARGEGSGRDDVATFVLIHDNLNPYILPNRTSYPPPR